MVWCGSPNLFFPFIWLSNCQKTICWKDLYFHHWREREERGRLILEAEKFHGVVPESRRPRKASDNLRTEELMMLILVQDPRSPLAQFSSSAGRKVMIFLLLFVWFKPSTMWKIPSYVGEGKLLYWIDHFKCLSHLETSSKTYPEIMFKSRPSVPSQVGKEK